MAIRIENCLSPFFSKDIALNYRNMQKNPHPLSSTIFAIIPILYHDFVGFFCFVIKCILGKSLRIFWHLLRYVVKLKPCAG